MNEEGFLLKTITKNNVTNYNEINNKEMENVFMMGGKNKKKSKKSKKIKKRWKKVKRIRGGDYNEAASFNSADLNNLWELFRNE